MLLSGQRTEGWGQTARAPSMLPYAGAGSGEVCHRLERKQRRGELDNPLTQRGTLEGRGPRQAEAWRPRLVNAEFPPVIPLVHRWAGCWKEQILTGQECGKGDL